VASEPLAAALRTNGMHSLPIKLAVLVNAFLLALPIGWCCTASEQLFLEHVSREEGQAEQAQPQTGCCHLPAHEGTPHSRHIPVSPVPARSGSACCCPQRVAPLGKVVALPDHLGACLIAVPSELATADDADLSDGGLTPAASVYGPPLRILHCVWRC
jgi:hypothetical protein